MHIGVSLCGYVNMSADVHGSQKTIHSPGSGITGNSERSVMGSGIQTLKEKSC